MYPGIWSEGAGGEEEWKEEQQSQQGGGEASYGAEGEGEPEWLGGVRPDHKGDKAENRTRNCQKNRDNLGIEGPDVVVGAFVLGQQVYRCIDG